MANKQVEYLTDVRRMTPVEKLVDGAAEDFVINGIVLNSAQEAILYRLAYEILELGKKRVKKIPKKKSRKRNVSSAKQR